MTDTHMADNPSAPARRRRRWPGRVSPVIALLLVVYAIRTRPRGPSWDWAGEPVPKGAPIAVTGHVIEANPSDFEAVIAKAAPGDVVLLADGEYSGGTTDPPRLGIDSMSPMVISKTISITRSGSEGKPVTLKAKGAAAIFTSRLALDRVSWLVIDGLTFRNNGASGLNAASCTNITVRNCTIDGSRTGRATCFEDVKRVIIEGNDVFGTPNGSGIVVLGSCSDIVIRCNRVHDLSGSGIALDVSGKTDKKLSGCLVERNVVCRCGVRGGAAVNCCNVLYSMFRKNVLYNNSGHGIAFCGGWWLDAMPANLLWRIVHAVFTPHSLDSRRNAVVGNTVYFEQGKGHNAFNLVYKCQGFYVHNNIFYGGLGGAIFVTEDSMRGLDIDDNVILTYKGQNLLGDRYPDGTGIAPMTNISSSHNDGGTAYTIEGWRAKGFDRHSKFEIDPSFVSVEKDDYHLMPNSPAIDAGANLPALCPTDFDGVKRPQGRGFDCGAYEFVPPQVRK